MKVSKKSSGVTRRKFTKWDAASASPLPRTPTQTNGVSLSRSPQPVLTQSVQPPSPEVLGSGPKEVVIVECADSASTSSAVVEGSHDKICVLERRKILEEEVAAVKGVYQAATHTHLIRRNLTDKDWEFISEHLSSLQKSKAVKAFLNCSDKLTHVYCVKCKRFVDNGKSGFVKHLEAEHPLDPIRLPCDICGIYVYSISLHTHWINHFFRYCCEFCGKQFALEGDFTKHSEEHLEQKHSLLKAERKSSIDVDLRWNCEFCIKSFKTHRGWKKHSRKHTIPTKTCDVASEPENSLALELQGTSQPQPPPSQEHKSTEGTFQNKHDEKEMHMEQSLREDEKKASVDVDRPWKCDLCRTSFKEQWGLKRHIRQSKRHINATKTCDAASKSENNLASEVQCTSQPQAPPSQERRSIEEISQNKNDEEEMHMEEDPPLASELQTTTAAVLPPSSEPQRAGGPMPQPPPKQIEIITLDDDDEPMDVENNSTPTPLQGISVEVEELSATDFQPAVMNVKLFRIGEDGPTNMQQIDPEQRFQILNFIMNVVTASADGKKVAFDTTIQSAANVTPYAHFIPLYK